MSKQSDVILYRLPPIGTRAERAEWLCEELGVPYEVVIPPGDFMEANKALKELNSMGTSPTARICGVTIVESGAVLQAIEMQVAGGGTTPPVGSPDLSYHLQWLHFAEGAAMTRITTEFLLKAVKGAPEHSPLTQRHMQGGERVLRYMEEHLAQHPYFGGKAFTSADIMMHYPVKMAEYLTRYDLAQFPHVATWKAKVEARPAFVKAGALVQSPGAAPG
jgi:glutathione S-transferase